MANAIRVTPEGEVTTVEMPEPGQTLQWFYRQIDCHTVDVVRLTETQDMWIDDEGDWRPLNPIACIMVEIALGYPGRIFGTVVLTRHDGRGNTVGLTADELEKIPPNLEIWRRELVRRGVLLEPAE